MGEAPTHLDLFSGIGGFALAARRAGFRTIGFCEIDPYCREVLAKNFMADAARTQSLQTGEGNSSEGRLSERFGQRCRIIPNIFDLDGRDFAGVSLITGGFPCQPFSVAGKRGGASDDRAIWPQMFRVISEARPAWVLGENVLGIIPMELDNVLSDLEGIGYATRSFVIPACAVDARHRRDRLWIIGRRNLSDRTGEGLEGRIINGIQEKPEIRPWEIRGQVSDSELPERGNDARNKLRGTQQSVTCVSGSDNGRTRPESGCCEWQPEPGICRVVNGLRNRVDRLKGLGNAIVPQVAYEILREIRRLI